MGVLLGVRFHGLWRTTVAVALSQHGIDRRTFDFVVARFELLLRLVDGLVRIVGEVKSKTLQLGNGRLQLRNRRTDVGELDNVRFGRFGQGAQFGQRVVRGLVARQNVRHGGQNAAAQRNVSGFHRHACFCSEGLDNGKKAVGRQCRRLIREGVENLGHAAAKVANPR